MQYLIQLLLMLSLGIQEAPPPTEPIYKVDQVPVLMYHHMVPQAEIGAEMGNDMVVSVEQFAEQMKWLKNQGWQTISTDQLKNYIEKGAPLPQKPFMITFDDGYTSNFLYATPILKTVDFKAVVFVITDHMRDTERLYQGRKMSWLDLKAIQSTFEIHNHTHYFHKQRGGIPFLLLEPPAAVQKDLETAYNIIETNIPGNSRVFAAPYGAYNNNTLKVLANLKTKMAFNTKKGYAKVGTPLYEIPRFYVTPKTTMAAFEAIFVNASATAAPTAPTTSTALTPPTAATEADIINGAQSDRVQEPTQPRGQ